MLESILFVMSTVCVILYTLKVVSIIAGNTMNVPVPLLHWVGVQFSHTYISTPAIAYQVYFWSVYAGIIGG